MTLSKIKSKEIVINKDPLPGKVSIASQLGFYGNIWVRGHYMHKAGFTNGGGHTHNFDHITLLATGSILVEVEGFEPKEFIAPTFITIDKNHCHKFTALTDEVVYYCVFAMKDMDGEIINGEDHSGFNNPHSAY